MYRKCITMSSDMCLECQHLVGGIVGVADCNLFLDVYKEELGEQLTLFARELLVYESLFTVEGGRKE